MMYEKKRYICIDKVNSLAINPSTINKMLP